MISPSEGEVMRKWLIGCGVLFGVMVLLCIGSVVWLLRPPNIEIPPRQYPPNNAYEQYRKIGAEMHARLEKDTRLRQIEDALLKQQPVSNADRAYYLQRIQPYLRAYAPLTIQPCKAVFEYDPHWKFPEMAQMRRIARAEHYLVREALRRGDYRDALNRIERVNRLADQMRNGGATIHYLVGVALNSIIFAPLREELPRLRNRATLERIVQIAQRYETARVPLWKAIEEEKYFILSVYDKLARGELDLSTLTADKPSAPTTRGGMAPFVNLALPEFRRMMHANIEELKKPHHERDEKVLDAEPRQLLNAILYPVFARISHKEAQEIAVLRLVGCAAAIRLYKQRTGKYPASLDALQLGEMIIDPFTGKPFRYRVEPNRGFLLYSVGENRIDDGGFAPYNGGPEPRGDLTSVSVRLPESLQGVAPAKRPLAPPVWLQ